MLVGAWRSTGFLSDLLLNLGASVVLAAISYVIFDPLFEEARKARVQEHLSFDQQAFVSRLNRSGRRVRILDTWTILLEQRHREETLTAIRAALGNGAQVQLLLLDPDCTAAQQRSEELERQRVDVPRQIRTNLRHLAAFSDALDSRLRQRLQVRLYDASPSIQLYQWDGRALISFFPIGKLSFNVPQLEVDMDSPWGGFVHARFEELWEHEQATLEPGAVLVGRGHAAPRRLGRGRGARAVRDGGRAALRRLPRVPGDRAADRAGHAAAPRARGGAPACSRWPSPPTGTTRRPTQ